MEFGIWPSEYALGEKWFYNEYKLAGYKDSDIRERLQNNVHYSSTMQERQKRAEAFLELLGGSHHGGSHGGSSALFGPIDRSKENVERMHSITLSMGADTGKHDNTPTAYNAATVPLYALQNQDGTYVTLAGSHTNDPEKAWTFTSTTDAHEARKHNGQTIVEV